MKNIKPIDFYTESDEPLMTREGIRFFFKYKNIGTEEVEKVKAEILMGKAIRNVSLPGIAPQEEKTVEMVLTNNISDELSEVGVRLGTEPEDGIMKTYKWYGKVDIQIGELERFEDKDTDTEVFYQMLIHNKGTRRAHNIQITIEKDNEHYGEIYIPELAPKTSSPVNLALKKSLEGLYKISVMARIFRKSQLSASRSFHIQINKQ